MSIMSEVILVGSSFLAIFGAAKDVSQKNRNITLVIKTKFVQFMKFFFTIAVFFWGFIFLLPKGFAYSEQQFNRDLKNYNVKLQIFESTTKPKAIEFRVAIADNDKTRVEGLMNLQKLASNQGMLFIFDNNQIVNMWMKNTIIALDMIFIDENDVIVNIKENTEPFSLAIISSQKPAKKVLEINAGLSKKLGIKNGQKIVYKNY